MKTNAAVLREGHGEFQIEELELNGPQAGEALVRMVASGMCHTDLLARELPADAFAGPAVYGHEGAGVIEALGDGVEGFSVGDHVVLSFSSCGECPGCSINRPASCFDFTPANLAGMRPDGSSALADANGDRVGSHYFGQSSFSSYAAVSQRSLVKVDQSADLTKLGPLGCGVQTGAGAIFNTLDVQPGSSLVIAGAGALGLSAVMAAKIAGAETIIAVDRHQNRLDLATRFGATHTVSVAPDALTDAIIDITSRGADYCFDSTGSAEVARACINGLTNLGVYAVAGVNFGELTLDYMSLISSRTIKGVIEGDSVPQEFIPKLVQLNAEGKFPFDELITTFPFAEINAAEAASLDGSVIKPVLLFD